MPRCSAITNAGRRCRCRAGADGLCGPHRAHGDKKPPPPTLSEQELAWIRLDIATPSPFTGFTHFCRRYYTILRELYNVAGAEMEEQYILYCTIGRGAFNALHTKTYRAFRSRIE